MRMRHLLLGCLLATVACGSAEVGSAPSPSPSASASVTMRPSSSLALVGRWYVDVPGQRPGAVSVVIGQDLTAFLKCGVLDGAWKADGRQGLFVADLFGGDDACFRATGPQPVTWLTSATAFRTSGANRVLLDASGTTLAVLRPGAHPTAGPNRASSYADPPTITSGMRTAAVEPAPLPAGVRAPSQHELQRRWAPMKPSRTFRAFVAFGTDGKWTGSDGCNGAGGRYALGDSGRLIATSGASTLIGCDNSPLPVWVGQASRVGLVGSQLAFFDAAGKELGRAKPA